MPGTGVACQGRRGEAFEARRRAQRAAWSAAGGVERGGWCGARRVVGGAAGGARRVTNLRDERLARGFWGASRAHSSRKLDSGRGPASRNQHQCKNGLWRQFLRIWGRFCADIGQAAPGCGQLAGQETCPRGRTAHRGLIHPGSWTADPGGWTADPGGWTADPGGWTANPGGWTADPGSWITDSGAGQRDRASARASRARPGERAAIKSGQAGPSRPKQAQARRAGLKQYAQPTRRRSGLRGCGGGLR